MFQQYHPHRDNCKQKREIQGFWLFSLLDFESKNRWAFVSLRKCGLLLWLVPQLCMPKMFITKANAKANPGGIDLPSITKTKARI